MPNINPSAVALFMKKAALASITVAEVKDMREALIYALDVCGKKEFCELLPVGCEQSLSPSGAAHCVRAVAKTLAAPGLDDETWAELERLGKEKEFTILRGGMRDCLAGIDVGFTRADAAIAETATCVLESASEDLRLATMICETHVVALKKSLIARNSYDIEEYLQKLMSNGPMYTAFISGPSRTADIERVLTIGVHGPLAMHVALMEA